MATAFSKQKVFISFVYLLPILNSCSDSSWPSEDQDTFLEECEEEGGQSTYCKCYLEGVMKKYPNPSDADNMDFETAVEISSQCK